MKNQDQKNCFPNRNRVEQISNEKMDKDYQSITNLGYFINVWLPLIGIHLRLSPKVSFTLRVQINSSEYAGNP